MDYKDQEFSLLWPGWPRGYVHALQAQAVSGAGRGFLVGAVLSVVVAVPAGLPGMRSGLPTGRAGGLRAAFVPAGTLRPSCVLRRAAGRAAGWLPPKGPHAFCGWRRPGDTAHPFPLQPAGRGVHRVSQTAAPGSGVGCRAAVSLSRGKGMK